MSGKAFDIAEQACYRWKATYGGDARKLKQLEEEN